MTRAFPECTKLNIHNMFLHLPRTSVMDREHVVHDQHRLLFNLFFTLQLVSYPFL